MSKITDHARYAHKIEYSAAHDSLASASRKLESLSILLLSAIENPQEPYIGIGITDILDGIAAEVASSADTTLKLWNDHSADELKIDSKEPKSA